MEAELHLVSEVLFSELWCQAVVNEDASGI